jgi:nickel/cobalt exporter
MSLSDVVLIVQDLHRAFHEHMAGDLRALQEAGSGATFASLVSGGFLYGALHAIGPGHGKVIVGAYMFADGRTLRHGLLITALSSLLQAVVAITLVLTLFFALGLARSTTEAAAMWLECASLVLMAAVGMMLALRGAAVFRAGSGTAWAGPPAHSGGGARCGCTTCGRAPTAHGLRKVQSLRGTAAVVASIGLRPCSGALVLMFLACLMGHIWAGVAATLAMGVGTGLSVSAIAVAAVQSRRWLLHLVSATESRLAAVTGLAAVLGGAVIIGTATLLLAAALPSAIAGG